YLSARFYETGADEFGFLNTCFMDREYFVCQEPRHRTCKSSSFVMLLAAVPGRLSILSICTYLHQ
ncbi:MAG TPA: hypothetical protein VGW31_06325, partial [Hanamia sp.]|nr:hypothetical protein [Hanamia sp.]